MNDARRMGKSELFSHFAERFEVKRTQAREYFDELTVLAEKELKRSGEFVLPGMVKLVVQKRKARMGRNPRRSRFRRRRWSRRELPSSSRTPCCLASSPQMSANPSTISC